jgi:hypothetical protein
MDNLLHLSQVPAQALQHRVLRLGNRHLGIRSLLRKSQILLPRRPRLCAMSFTYELIHPLDVPHQPFPHRVQKAYIIGIFNIFRKTLSQPPASTPL